MSEASAETERSAAAEEASPVSNVSLGKYALIEELGRGGMAVVYLAIDQSPSAWKRPLVIKVLRDLETADSASWETTGPSPVDMFFNEAALAARLNHPNVVKIHEACSEGSKHVIVMEYLDGRPLNHILTRARALGRPLGLCAELRIMTDVLAGLHHAHELRESGNLLGLVHRDVSPHNIYVTYEGQVKVLDFGIAKLTSSKQHTEAGVLKGKISYMSPEQVADTPLDRRTDVFAAGIVLWEMLTGQYFWGDKNELQVLNALLHGFEVAPPRTINPAIPERLSNACLKALAFDMADRFATCEELRLELLEILATLPQISNQQIGALLSSMFRDVREKHRDNVNARLSGLNLPEAALAELRQQFSIPTNMVESTTGAGTWESSLGSDNLALEQTQSLAYKRKGVHWLVSLGIAAAVGAVVFSIAWRLRPEQLPNSNADVIAAPRAPVAASATPMPQATPAKTQDMSITLRVSPSVAKVSWDGKPITANPAVRQFKRDGRLYEAEITAPGYETKKVSLFLTGNQSLILTLEKEKRARGSARITPPSKPESKPEPEAQPVAETEPETKPGIDLDKTDPWN